MKLSINARKIIISMLFAAILLLGLWRICPIMYQNNDDKFLLYMMSGYTTGAPALESIFGGVLWAGFVSMFYHLYAGITWYTVLTLVVLFLSVTVIIRSMLISENIKVRVVEIAIMLAIFLGVLAYFLAALQYTVTAAYVGAAGVCALILCFEEENVCWRNVYLVLSCVFIVLSYNIRKQMGLVSVSCYCFILLYYIFEKNFRTVIKKAVIILSVFAISFTINTIYELGSGVADFDDYYSVVQRWIDYPHLDIADDTKGVYKSVGWDEELYEAANEWFFLDERVNEDTISTINEVGTNNTPKTFTEKLEIAKGGIINKQMVNVQVGVWFVILVIANLGLVHNKKKSLQILLLDGIFLFFVLVCFYFCFAQGRFPLRVYQALLIIYAIPSFTIIFNEFEKEELVKTKMIAGFVVFFVVLGTYKFYPAGNMLYQLRLATHDADRQKYINEVMDLEQYAADNTDNLYLYDFELSQPSAPFVSYKKAPYNIMFWGGWTYNSPVYYKQLAANGRDDLRPEDLIDGNVYLCGKYHDEVIEKYMESVFGDLEIEDVDHVGDVVIYRFIK